MKDLELSDNTKVYVKLEKLAGEMKVQNEINSKILEGQDRLYKTVYGDGNGDKGLLVRTDRIEQTQKRQKWLTGLISVPVVGAIVDYIIEVFKKTN